MALDQVIIGERIRQIREKQYKETRQYFAERCGLSEVQLGKIERGNVLISISALNKICSVTGISSDYILYGKAEKNLSVRRTIENILDRSSKEELKVYYKFITTIRGYVNKSIDL